MFVDSSLWLRWNWWVGRMMTMFRDFVDFVDCVGPPGFCR